MTTHELNQNRTGFWTILALHLPSDRKFAFVSNANDFDGAIDEAEKASFLIDPFCGNWQWASQWIDFDAVQLEMNTDFEAVQDDPIPFKLTERFMENSFQYQTQVADRPPEMIAASEEF